MLSSICKFHGHLWHSNFMEQAESWMLDVIQTNSTKAQPTWLLPSLDSSELPPRNDLVNSIADYIDLHFEVLKRDSQITLTKIKRLQTTVTWKNVRERKIIMNQTSSCFYLRLLSFRVYQGMIAANVIVSYSWMHLQWHVVWYNNNNNNDNNQNT